jgi:hypothetical protein
MTSTAAASFADTVTRRLLRWSAVSVTNGLPLAASSEPLLRGMGQQFIAWGAIDGAIALAGRWSNRRQGAPAETAQQIDKLRRLLLINAGLDVLYVTGGTALALHRGQNDPYWRGVGLGIVAQGGFLLAFDLWHALNAPRDA